MQQIRRTLAVLVVAGVLAVTAGNAVAEMNVSVTITGSLEEILPLLEQLNTLRGGEHAAAVEEGRIAIQSVANAEEAGAPGDAAIVEGDRLQFGAVEAAGSPAEPGDVVLLHVKLLDPNQQVDTLVGTVDAASPYVFDFFDNGTHGDAVAQDGVWSCALPISGDWREGDYLVQVTAFDAFGGPVRVLDEAGALKELSTVIPLTVGTALPPDQPGDAPLPLSTAPVSPISTVPVPADH